MGLLRHTASSFPRQTFSVISERTVQEIGKNESQSEMFNPNVRPKKKRIG